MKSRITIEVDFENGNQPVIQIMQGFSDDVRDSLVKSFLQKLNGSSFCKIQYVGSNQGETPETTYNRIFIWPIPNPEIRDEFNKYLDLSTPPISR